MLSLPSVPTRSLAVEARGAAAHPARGRDHQPRRQQHPHPAAHRELPGAQDAGAVRRHRQLGAVGDLRLPRLAGVDPDHREPLPDRPGRHRQEPPARRPRRRRRPRRSPRPLLHRSRARRDPSTAGWPSPGQCAWACSRAVCSACTRAAAPADLSGDGGEDGRCADVQPVHRRAARLRVSGPSGAGSAACAGSCYRRPASTRGPRDGCSGRRRETNTCAITEVPRNSGQRLLSHRGLALDDAQGLRNVRVNGLGRRARRGLHAHVAAEEAPGAGNDGTQP